MTELVQGLIVIPTENDEIKVYGPSTKALTKMLLFVGAASIPVVILVARSDDPVGQNFFSYIIISVAAVICLNLWSFHRELPQLKLTSKGIEVRNIFSRKFHSWAGAGTFRTHKLDSKHIHVGYLCAHPRETEEILRRGNTYIPADHNNAEIVITLQGLSAGLSDEEAEKLCQEVNEWRERYSPQEYTPENAQQDTVSQVVADLKKKQIKAKLRIYSAVAIVLGIIFYNVVWVKDHSQLKDIVGRIQVHIKE